MGKTSYEICESLCQSMAIIAQKAVNEIQCDKTIVCTIVDNSKKDLGYYTVSDGNVKFTASSDSKYTYRVDDQVQVTIPQGDYSRQKVIIGKYTADDENIPVAYVSPLETVITMTDNILPSTTGSLTANGSTPSIVLFEGTLNDSEKMEISNNQNYTSLALSAKFKCLLGSKKMQTGNYGLRLTINYTHADNPNYSDVYNDSLTFKDMLGNPYDFPFYLKQEKKINIVNLGQITGLTITFFQDNNFTEFDGEHVVKLEPDTAPNIFVSDVVISFGNDLILIPDNKFEIYSNNPSTYSQTKALNDIGYGQKTIHSIWYNKDEHNQFIGFTDGIPTFDNNGNHIPYDEDAYQKEHNERMTGASVFIKEEDGSIPRITQALQIYGDADSVNGLLQTLDNSMEYEFEKDLLLSEQGLKSLVLIQKTTPEPDTNPLLDIILEQIENMETVSLPAAYAAVAELGDLLPSDAVVEIEPAHILYKDILRKFGEAYNTLQENSAASIDIYGEQADQLKADIDILYNNFNTRWATFLDQANYIFVDLMKTFHEEYSSLQPKLEVLSDDYNWIIEKWAKLKEKVDNIRTNQDIRYNELKLRIIGPNRDLTLFDEEYEAFLEEYKNKYCIYWYQYKNGYTNEDDRYLQKNWKRLPNARRINGVAVIPTPDQMTEGEPLDPLPGMPHRYASDNSYLPRSSTPLPPIQMDYNLEAEKFQAVLIFNHEPYYSNELIFENEDPVINTELTNAIYIELGPNAKDAYPYYDSDNKLSIAESNVVRQLRIRYNGVKEKDEALINTWVYWYIPQGNSMLTYNHNILVEKGFTYLDPENTARLSAHIPHLKDGYACYFKRIGNYTENGIEKLKEEDTYFYFGLYNQYASSRMNNSIVCRVVTTANQFDTEKYFTFNNSGTSGTSYTLSLQPTTRKNAIINKSGDITALEMRAAFYDYYGQEIVDETAPKVTWGWMDDAPNKPFQSTSNLKGENYRDITGKLNFPEQCGYNILQCSVQWKKITKDEGSGEDVESDSPMTLTTYYPVPYATGDYYIDGATTVIYDDLGKNPSANQNSYKIYELETNKEKTGVKWSIYYYDQAGILVEPEESMRKYLPKLGERKIKINPTDTEETTEYFLSPTTMYLSDLKIYPVVACTSGGHLLWAQPILITQNRYGSTLLNNWDESLTIDEKNGTILATMMGAGYKDNQNRFYGVLMGDVQKADIEVGNKIGLGLYGFNAGAQSFCWNVDGTGFIGKSGHGRIMFDGNKGTIHSASYEQSGDDKWGMNLDLDDGYFEILGPQGEGSIYISDGRLRISDDEVISTPFLQIKSLTDKILFNIGPPLVGDENNGNYSYYMQTNDFKISTLRIDDDPDTADVIETTGETGAGLRLDLEKGNIEAYRFNLKAEIPYKNDDETTNDYWGSYLQMQAEKNNLLLKVYYTDQSRGFDILHIEPNDYYFKSFNYVPGAAGTEIDMNEGSIILYPNEPLGDGTEPQFLRLSGADYNITVDGTPTTLNYPLLIGSDANPAFRVKWDGSFIVNGGAFEVKADGSMKATAGTIGGWTINGSTLQSLGGTIILEGGNGNGTGPSISTQGWGGGGGYKLDETMSADNAVFSNLSMSSLAVFGDSCQTYIDGQLGINVGGTLGTADGTPPSGPELRFDLTTDGQCWFGGSIGIKTEPVEKYGLKVDGSTYIIGNAGIGAEPNDSYALNLGGNINLSKGSALYLNGVAAFGGGKSTEVTVKDYGIFSGGVTLYFTNGILTDIQDGANVDDGTSE